MAIVTLLRAAGLAGMALLATLDAPAPAMAEVVQAGRPVLRRDITVSADVITLGDLVENAGPAAGTPAFRAPALGKAGTIQAARVVEAARAAGLSLDSGTVSQVVVSRASRRVPRAEIESAIARALVDRYALDRPDVSIALDAGEQAIHVEPEATGALRVAELAYDPRSRRVDAVIALQGSRTLTLKPLRVLGQTVDMVSVPILQHPIQRGDSVTAADVVVERRPRADYPTAGFVDPANLVGRIARTAMAAGAALREADVVKQEIVEKNAVVTVLYETPGVALQMRGKALEGGGMGDTVLVMNPQSKRTLQGVVAGAGVVKVNLPMPGRLAEGGAAPQAVQ
ncbi:flagella basal body P-ring formation protein FlgA [Alsobacter soli]|uniref:Flagella basal body P-ring formation protein FlgA n=1 Tax=Alsobacter soli TaxID=2109933 RepID=A0A2T1HUB4_9HYPH|nr:flagellar basal body P-ring formation chaperone FlgA [Alsobacter soli]PSC05231.1 flagella basal body P-ring formation protein FlgA [Alsobacter soli]